MTQIALQHVKYLPKQLSPGILYVSHEYSLAGHLCACGCGSKVITPLGPTEWKFTERHGRPTLYPSIGNWQLPCRSHYFISAGQIEWAPAWTDAEIRSGRRAEELRREQLYEAKEPLAGWFTRLMRWVRKWLGH